MDQQTYQIIGAAIEVHKELGRGFLEAVYQEALELEFSDRDIPFQSQLELPIFYKGKKLKTHYRSDFVCYDDIMVELKALARLGDGDLAQVLNYLKASRHRRAVLMNFGSKSLTTRAACMVAQCRLIQIRIWGPPKSAQCLIEGPSLVVTTPRDRA